MTANTAGHQLRQRKKAGTFRNNLLAANAAARLSNSGVRLQHLHLGRLRHPSGPARPVRRPGHSNGEFDWPSLGHCAKD